MPRLTLSAVQAEFARSTDRQACRQFFSFDDQRVSSVAALVSTPRSQGGILEGAQLSEVNNVVAKAMPASGTPLALL